MWVWLVKLIGGWLPTGTKPFGEWIGKIIWVVGIVLLVSLGTNVFEKLFPAKPTQINLGQGSTYVAGEQRDVVGIGCNMWRWYVKGGMKQK
uniref:Uncharacterized protein n=1 Tax=viral metagenome TaxID=1070528 RepID=A0A6M3LU28_9ZZZZ